MIHNFLKKTWTFRTGAHLFILSVLTALPLFSQNFTTGGSEAGLYGIHEIILRANLLPETSARYSTFPIVRFSNDEVSMDVLAFYDGNGNGGEGALWKARLYVSKAGSWTWSVIDHAGLSLTGSGSNWNVSAKDRSGSASGRNVTTSGHFIAKDRNPELSGKLRQHNTNPNRWATDRKPGMAFLGLGDTQYTLMDKVWTREPDPELGGAGDWDAVIDDSYANGATLIRAGAFGGYSRWDGTTTVGPKKYPRPNWPWADPASDGNKDIYDLIQLSATDERLVYAIDAHEDLYFELILSPKTKGWGRSWKDPKIGCTPKQIKNYRKYMTARLSAFPNVVFQLVYDIDFQDTGGGCGANPQGFGEENYAFAQGWLEWLRDNDPFQTMRCIGNGNDYDDPFPREYYNQEDPPPTYLHDEAIGDISGKTVEKYYGKKMTPIFHGEDSYELDLGWGAGTSPSENHPEYYFRRVFWSDLLSGGYPCYGGGYKGIVPYTAAYDRIPFYSERGTYHAKLRGQDDVIHIKHIFAENELDLATFHPADSLALDGPPAPGQLQVAYNSQDDAYLIYHPNAATGEADYDPNHLCESYADSLATLFTCTPSNKLPTVTLRLSAGKLYNTKWFDPSNGESSPQGEIIGKDVPQTLSAPADLQGRDAVLYLKGERKDKQPAIIAHRGGRDWAPENTLAAFRKCADNHLDWETDLHMTADGEIILMHDMTLDRTTNAEVVFGGKDIPVHSKTLAEIKQLDAGSHFSEEYTGEMVPTLDEFLDCFLSYAPPGTIISMDTKLDRISAAEEVYQRIIDKIAERDLFDRVFIEVSEIDRVNNTRYLKNGEKIQYAIWVNNDLEKLKAAIASGYFSRIHASYRIAKMAERVHTGGVPYYSAHPVENRQHWDAVRQYDIDGVSTDKADVTLLILREEIPTCRIVMPRNGSVFKTGETIRIRAEVGDTDSSISKVEFYCNGNLIGQDGSAPYSISLHDLARGSYSLTAKVYDQGRSKISVPVSIHVKN